MKNLFLIICLFLLINAENSWSQPLTVTISAGSTFGDECDCPNPYIQASLSISGGSAPFTQLWSTGATTPTIMVYPGTYSVTVTDAGLNTATDIITISHDPIFWTNLTYIAPTPGQCNGLLFFDTYCSFTQLGNAGNYTLFDGYYHGQPVCNPGPIVNHEVYTASSNCPSNLNGFSLDPSIYYTGPCYVVNTTSQSTIPCSNTQFLIVNTHPLNTQGIPQDVMLNYASGHAKLVDMQGNQLGNSQTNFNGIMQAQDSFLFDFGLNITGSVIFIYDETHLFSDTFGIQLRDTFNLLENDCGSLSGKVYFDNNLDCIYDDTVETLIPHMTFNIQPLNINVFSNDNGHFNAYLPYGTYTAVQTNPYGFDQKCPVSPFTFTLDSQTPLINLEISDTSQTPLVCDLNVSMNSNPARPGFNYNLNLKVQNSNLLPTTATTLTLQLDSTLTFISADNGGLYSNFEISWNVPPLNGFEELYFSAIMNIPSSTLIGTVLTSTATLPQLPCDTLPGNNTIVYQRTVTGSYDPNEKSVSPVGVGPQNIIPPNHKLQYTIDFENVGNDTAFRVIVIDTLSTNLDVSTLQVEMSSHDYFVQINSPNILRFTFDNILLPDSATNNEDSKGFITFSIDQLPGLSDGTIIENEAAIYFDYNLPVITNTVFNTIKNGPVAICQNVTAYLDSNGTATIDPQQLNNDSYDFYGIAGVSVSQNSFDCSQTGMNAVTFYITSVNGLTDSCAATVTVVDNISPVVFCKDTIISMDSGCFASISPQDLITVSSDNCNLLSYSLSQSTFDCTNIGLNNVTLTVTDASGNTSQCPVVVTIVDVTGIDSPESQLQNASLIPNPSSGKLKLPEIAIGGSLIVSDFTGRTVYSENNIQLMEKDFSNLPEGIYIFKFVTRVGEVRLKWVKMD